MTLLVICSSTSISQNGYVRESGPHILTYEEILALGGQNTPPEKTAAKLQQLLSTPFISNTAYYSGAKPYRPATRELGPLVRVVFWNIERGLHLDEIKLAFSDKKAFLREAQAHSSDPSSDAGEKKSSRTINFETLEQETDALQSADAIVLNEVDWGMKRTGYRNVVRELAEAVHMNWAYGVEFVEVDSMAIGTEKFEEVSDSRERQELLEAIKVDPSRLKAMHGNAVLSRYPVRKAVLLPFRNQPYDWYGGELSLPSLEKGKRFAARIMGEKLGREVRRGGRNRLVVDLDVPGTPDNRMVIVATHLENRADPKGRRLQMVELLECIRETSARW